MKIVQITDCHLFADINKVGYQDINPADSVRRVLQQVKTQQPDLLLVTGDVSADGSAASYRHFGELLQQQALDCQVGILPGNHDDLTQLNAHFQPAQLWHTSVHQYADIGWHVHLLNTYYQGTQGRLSAKDLAELTRHLETHPDVYHLVAVHHHPIDCGGWMDKHTWQNKHEFMYLLTQHPAVRGVAYGHIHCDITQLKNDCLFMATPSTCWQWAVTQDFAASDLKPGYRVINLAENGQIKTDVFRISES